MPGTPTTPQAALTDAIQAPAAAVSAQAGQQGNVVTDPTAMSGDPQHNFATYVDGPLQSITGIAGYGAAVWVGSSRTGQWVQIGGGPGGSGLATPGDLAWSMASTKAGYLLCDGSSYLVANYPALAAACPELVSGSNVILPDFRGRSPVGADPTGVHMPVGHPALGASGGEETHTLVTGEAAQKAVSTGTGTTGTGTTGTESGTHTHGSGDLGFFTYKASAGSGISTASISSYAGIETNTGTESATHTHSVPGLSVPALSIAGSSAASAHNTMHPYLAANCFIKY
jgi:hypothetical protein